MELKYRGVHIMLKNDLYKKTFQGFLGLSLVSALVPAHAEIITPSVRQSLKGYTTFDPNKQRILTVSVLAVADAAAGSFGFRLAKFFKVNKNDIKKLNKLEAQLRNLEELLTNAKIKNVDQQMITNTQAVLDSFNESNGQEIKTLRDRLGSSAGRLGLKSLRIVSFVGGTYFIVDGIYRTYVVLTNEKVDPELFPLADLAWENLESSDFDPIQKFGAILEQLKSYMPK